MFCLYCGWKCACCSSVDWLEQRKKSRWWAHTLKRTYEFHHKSWPLCTHLEGRAECGWVRINGLSAESTLEQGDVSSHHWGHIFGGQQNISMSKSVSFSSPPEETYGVIIRPFTISLYLVIFLLSYNGIKVFSEYNFSCAFGNNTYTWINKAKGLREKPFLPNLFDEKC
jgi:hypothetical protein